MKLKKLRNSGGNDGQTRQLNFVIAGKIRYWITNENDLPTQINPQ
jgi:hypothetical protein